MRGKHSEDSRASLEAILLPIIFAAGITLGASIIKISELYANPPDKIEIEQKQSVYVQPLYRI